MHYVRRTGFRFFSAHAKEMFLKNVKNAPPTQFARLRNTSDSDSVMSVLVPLVVVNGRESVLLTKRSIHLRSHRGEVCFPGGRRDLGETPVETALRETREEIGIPEDAIDIWGPMKGVFRRQMDQSVTPYVGFIKDSQTLLNLNVNEDEVQAVFTVPLDEIRKNAAFTLFKTPKMKYTLPLFDTKEFTVIFNAKDEYLHKNQRIWGLSAVILHQAMTLLDPSLYDYDIKIRLF
ncbi:unnamed protein product [Caenorhabditis bovis]|uniref:Nudix hydrolase domain-containing protein n=1 Tax=Caenorhabditis bovis TaxID=2654633 RepID=A0A8S1EKM6_9PELO|nr:unnamed protein product [Caenorhabditis bovis]